MRRDDAEGVVLDARPHGRVLVRPVLVLLVTAGAAGFLAARAGTGPQQAPLRLAVALGAVVVLLPLAVLPWLRWWSTRVLLTDRRLVVRRGVLRRVVQEVPLARVGDVRLTQSLAQRAQGCGALLVQTGDGEPLQVPVLGRVDAVRQALGGRSARPPRR